MIIDGKQLRARSVALDRLAKDILRVRLGSAFTVAGTTLADVTGLSLALRAGVAYLFEWELVLTNSNVLGTTIGLSVNYSGTLSALTQSAVFMDSATNGTGAGANQANNTAITDGSRLSTANLPARVAGSIVTTTAGNLTLRAQRSAATVTVLAGAWGLAIEI